MYPNILLESTFEEEYLHLLLIMPTLNSRDKVAKDLNFILKILILRRELDILFLVIKSSKCKCIANLISLIIINLEASKFYLFDISMISTFRKLIISDSNVEYV